MLYITFSYEEQKKKKELKKVKIASTKLNQTNWDYSSMKWKQYLLFEEKKVKK